MNGLLDFISEVYQEKIQQLIDEGVIMAGAVINGKIVFQAAEIMIKLGEVDIEEIAQRFSRAFQAARIGWETSSRTTMYAILFRVAEDRIGLQEDFTTKLRQAGFNISKSISGTQKKEDETTGDTKRSAVMGFVFDIHHTLLQRQIEFIIRGMAGKKIDDRRDKIESGDFGLTEWAAGYGVVI